MVTNWIAWKLGRGSKIKIGEDSIVGIVGFYKLSKELIRMLNGRGITFLCHAVSHHGNSVAGKNWKSDTYLNL